jgi:glyoxylase-like metal-dependent hydrolase (beta-lactamase superfamily II)
MRLTVAHQLSPHLYIVYAEYPHCTSSNVYLVAGRDPLLIDCGSFSAAPLLLSNIAMTGVDIRDIDRAIATHGHCDHVQGFHALREANPDLKLLIHPLDEPLVHDPDLIRNACYLYNGLFVRIGPELCVRIEEGDRIPAGDGDLVVLHTPGHTDGSVCLWGEIDGHKVLFAGDTVGGSMPGLEGFELQTWASAVRAWKDSLGRIMELEIDWVLNGHEPMSGLPLTRKRLERGVASFGKMLNPWFSLGEDDEPVAAVEEVTPS